MIESPEHAQFRGQVLEALQNVRKGQERLYERLDVLQSTLSRYALDSICKERHTDNQRAMLALRREMRVVVRWVWMAMGAAAALAVFGDVLRRLVA